MTAAIVRVKPPELLKLLAHDIRWRILVALAHSDYRVHELVTLLKQPPNLVSYHLQRLRVLHLVSNHRSTADGRDIYYSLNLDRLKQLYLASGQAMHPDLLRQAEISQPHSLPTKSHPTRVLFLCVHNSARSQMAEGLLRHLSQGRVEASSAGSEPGEVHPYAVRVMVDLGIDISSQRSKHLDEFRNQSFDYIITVCDRIRESCPVFPNDPKRIHWSFPDPAEVEASHQYRAFERTAQELLTRIRYLLLMINRFEEGSR